MPVHAELLERVPDTDASSEPITLIDRWTPAECEVPKPCDITPENVAIAGTATFASGRAEIQAAAAERRQQRLSQAERSKGGKRGRQDTLGLYLDKTDQFDLLTAAQEVALSKDIREGDAARERQKAGITLEEDIEKINIAQKSKQQFINSNLLLIVHVAMRYPLPETTERIDLIQQGYLGLERAVEKFDGRKGFKFSTYAVLWISQFIVRFIDQECNLIRIPREKNAEIRLALRHSNGDTRVLTEQQEQLHEITHPISYDDVTEDSAPLLNLLTGSEPDPEASTLDHVTAQEIIDVLGIFGPTTQAVLVHRLGLEDGDPKLFREIDAELGIRVGYSNSLTKMAQKAILEDPELEHELRRACGQQG